MIRTAFGIFSEELALGSCLCLGLGLHSGFLYETSAKTFGVHYIIYIECVKFVLLATLHKNIVELYSKL